MIRRTHTGQWITVAWVIIWSLFPIYWALNTSLMTESNAHSVPAKFLPIPIDGANYAVLFSTNQNYGRAIGFSKSMLNTGIECVFATLIIVAISIMGAYAFARLRFRFRNLIFYATIATLSLPAYATLIPVYRIMARLGQVNTYSGLVAIYVSAFLPLALWILYNYFNTIPKSLEEAAFVDGVSPFRAMILIIIPLAGPGIASAAIITFLSTWGAFLFPLVMTTDIATQPLTVFITSLQGRHTVPYTLLNAVGVLTIVVPAAIVVFLNRYIIRGILAGSAK